MNTTTNMPKPRQLWNTPKVFLTGSDLVIEGKFYPLAQTLGAYVEVVPAPKVENTQAAAQTPKRPITFGSVMKGIGLASIIIFVILFSLFINDDNSSWGGSNTLYQLVLNSDFGRTTVIQNTNRGKLNKIAQEVNKQLMAQGRRPVTNSFEAAVAAR